MSELPKKLGQGACIPPSRPHAALALSLCWRLATRRGGCKGRFTAEETLILLCLFLLSTAMRAIFLLLLLLSLFFSLALSHLPPSRPLFTTSPPRNLAELHRILRRRLRPPARARQCVRLEGGTGSREAKRFLFHSFRSPLLLFVAHASRLSLSSPLPTLFSLKKKPHHDTTATSTRRPADATCPAPCSWTSVRQLEERRASWRGGERASGEREQRRKKSLQPWLSKKKTKNRARRRRRQRRPRTFFFFDALAFNEAVTRPLVSQTACSPRRGVL